PAATRWPASEQLTNAASEISHRKPDAKERDATEEQIVQLDHKFNQFAFLLHYLDFARYRYPIPASSNLGVLFGSASEVSASMILAKAPVVTAAIAQIKA